jgi:hypothetical protein
MLHRLGAASVDLGKLRHACLTTPADPVAVIMTVLMMRC